MTPRLDVPDGPGGPPLQVWNLRPELLPTVTAMIDGPYRRSRLPAREREAARMTIAMLNDCTICRDFRARSAQAGGATEDLYAHATSRCSPADQYDAWPLNGQTVSVGVASSRSMRTSRRGK